MKKKILKVIGILVALIALVFGVLLYRVYLEFEGLENLVLRHIDDVDSAIFDIPEFSKYRTVACMKWNARNASGRYEAWKTALFVRTESGWTLQSLDDRNCTDQFSINDLLHLMNKGAK